jgi:hypothetical protein
MHKKKTILTWGLSMTFLLLFWRSLAFFVITLLVIALVLISPFLPLDKSSYLPESIRKVSVISSFSEPGLREGCTVHVFKLDRTISEKIVLSGISYLRSDRSLLKLNTRNPYDGWSETPIPENIFALRAFSCRSDSQESIPDYELKRLIYQEIKNGIGYYTLTKNKEGAIIVLPEVSLVVFAYLG